MRRLNFNNRIKETTNRQGEQDFSTPSDTSPQSNATASHNNQANTLKEAPNLTREEILLALSNQTNQLIKQYQQLDDNIQQITEEILHQKDLAIHGKPPHTKNGKKQKKSKN